MDCSNQNVNDKEELLSPPPPSYQFSTQPQHQTTPTVILNNTTVIQQVAVPVVSLPIEITDINCFRKDTPRLVRRGFIRWVLLYNFTPNVHVAYL